MPDTLYLMIAAFLTTTVVMFVIWLVSERIKNAGIVDVAWGFGFVLVALIDFLLSTFNGWGNSTRSGLILLMVALWSLRLGFFLAYRFKRMWPDEDGRYKKYREDCGDKASQGLFLAFEMQALLLASLTLPFALAMTNSSETLSTFEIVGFTIWLIAFICEAISDHQLERFKSNKKSDGRTVCQVGFWNYSRHPNYFFEWLVWLSFFIFALGSPNGIYTIYCPMLMLLFLTKVTGVKATEEQAVRSKGQAYIDYQRTTSAFVPWFKR
ncbi:DUF1295 domain-containing protein [soil metagenome]